MKIFFLFCISISSSAQDDMCACSTYNLDWDIDMYGDFFPPETISNLNINKAEIYVRDINDTTNYNLKKEFLFDINGYLVKRSRIKKQNYFVHYYDEFRRDSLNKLVEFISYMQVPVDGMDKTSIHIKRLFRYDKLNRLVFEKEAFFPKSEGYSPDSISRYIKYEYDELNRIVYQVNHDYFEWDSTHFFVNRSWEYNSNNEGVENTSGDLSNPYYREVSFDENCRPLESKHWNSSKDSTYLCQIEEYSYNLENKITSYKTTTLNQWILDECPENGTYEECYYYNSSGLLNEIVHKYEQINCVIRIKYK